MHHPLVVRVLHPLRRLTHEVAGVGHRQRALGLDHLGQVEPFDILHREDDALTQPERRVGRHDVRVLKPRDGADLRQEPSQQAGPLHDVPAHHLEHLVAPHQPVVGQIDHPHPAASQLLDHLVVGMVGQTRRHRVGRRAALTTDGPRSVCDTGECRPVRGRPSRFPLVRPRSRPRKLSDDISATRLRQTAQLSRCLLTDSADGIIELAQAIGLQDLVGRVHGASAPITRSPGRGARKPMVDQSLKEKGRNSAGHAAQNHKTVQRQTDFILNFLGSHDLRRAKNTAAGNAATDHNRLIRR